MEKLFTICSYLILPFWALMIFLPGWSMTRRIMKTPLSAALPAVFYAALVLPRLVEIWTQVSRPGLPGIAGLLGSPAGATIAWLHFLAFDLFVGRWIYLDSRERGISAWLMAPVLYLTLMLGPCGFLLYLLIRRVKGALPSATSALPVSSILK
jgi:ABA4-like protein